MADEIRGTVSSLKELLSLLEKVKAQAGGESLVKNFLSMGTGDKDTALILQQQYKNLEDAAGSDLYTHTLKQANDELRNHVELLKIVERLRDSAASVPTPVATSAPALPVSTATSSTHTAITTSSTVKPSAALLKGETLVPGLRGQIEELAREAVERIGYQLITEVSHPSNPGFTDVNLGFHNRNAKTIGLNINKMVNAYQSNRFTGYSPTYTNTGYADASRKTYRDFTAYADLVDYILGIVTHEVSHAMQLPDKNVTTAQSELSTIQLEPRVAKFLFPDRPTPRHQPMGRFYTNSGEESRSFAAAALAGSKSYIESLRLNPSQIDDMIKEAEEEYNRIGREFNQNQLNRIAELKRYKAEQLKGNDPYKPLTVGSFTSFYGSKSVASPQQISSLRFDSPLEPQPAWTPPVVSYMHNGEGFDVSFAQPMSSAKVARTSVGRRDRDLTNEQLIKHLRNKKTERQLLTASAEDYTDSAYKNIQELLEISRSEELAARHTPTVQRAGSLYNNLFPKKPSSTNVMENGSLEDLRPQLIELMTPVLKKTGLVSDRRIKALNKNTNKELFDLFHYLVGSLVVRQGDEYEYQPVDIDPDYLAANMTQVIERIKPIFEGAISRPLVSHSLIQETMGSHADAIALALGNERYEPSSTFDPKSVAKELPQTREMRSPSGTVGNFITRNRVSLGRAQSSMRQALRNKSYGFATIKEGEDYGRGTQVAGYSASQLFGGGPDLYIEEQVKNQRTQINEEITRNDLVDVQIGTRTVKLPRTLANSRIAIQRAVASMSQDTTLVGRRGSEEGPIGVYGAGNLEASLLDLHKAQMMQAFLQNPTQEIPESLNTSFLESTVYQEESNNEQNSLRLYAARMMEQFQYQERQARLRSITGNTHSVRADAASERAAFAKNQQFLAEILHEDTTPTRRGELLGLTETVGPVGARVTQPVSLSVEQALHHMFGSDLVLAPFADASIGIRSTAQNIKAGLAAHGLNDPVQSYTTPTILQRIFQAGNEAELQRAVAGASREETYQQQIQKIGTPHTRVYMGREVEMGNTSGMVEKEVMDVISSFFGLTGRKDSSAFSALYHAGRITDDTGQIKHVNELSKLYNNNPAIALNSVFAGAEQLKEFSLQGLPILEYARLRDVLSMGGTLSKDEINQLEAAGRYMPALTNLTPTQLQDLARIDPSKNNPREIIIKIVSIIGKQIRQQIEKIISARAKDAGKTPDDVKYMLHHFGTAGKIRDEDRGFEGLLRAHSFFDETLLRNNPDITRAFGLLQKLGAAQDQGQTQAQFLSDYFGTHTPEQVALPPVVPEDRYPVMDAARALTQAETGRTTPISDAAFRYRNRGQERQSVDRYFSLIEMQTQDADPVKRARAVRLKAMHEAAAGYLGSPGNFRAGYIDASRGFSLGSQEERLQKFLNYQALKNNNSRTTSEQQAYESLHSEYTNNIDYYDTDISTTRINSPLIPGYMTSITASERDFVQSTPFQAYVSTIDEGDAGDVGYESPINVARLQKAFTPSTASQELALSIMRDDPERAIQLYKTFKPAFSEVGYSARSARAVERRRNIDKTNANRVNATKTMLKRLIGTKKRVKARIANLLEQKQIVLSLQKESDPNHKGSQVTYRRALQAIGRQIRRQQNELTRLTEKQDSIEADLKRYKDIFENPLLLVDDYDADSPVNEEYAKIFAEGITTASGTERSFDPASKTDHKFVIQQLEARNLSAAAIVSAVDTLFFTSRDARVSGAEEYNDQFPIAIDNPNLPSILQQLAKNATVENNEGAIPVGLLPEAANSVVEAIDRTTAVPKMRKTIQSDTLSPKQVARRQRQIKELEAKLTRTVAEEAKLSTLRAQLQRDSINQIIQNFPQSAAAGTGIPQLFDIVRGLTPRVSPSKMTPAHAVEINRLAAIAQIIEGMTVEEQNSANDVDFTDVRSRSRLASDRWDQVLSLLPVESAQKGRRFSRSTGNEATTVAGRVADDQQIADAKAAIAAVRSNEEQRYPVYFDLETQNPSVEFLYNFIDQKYKPKKSDTEEQKREKERAKQVALRYLAMQQRTAARSGRSYDLTTDTKFIQRLGLTEAQLNKYRAPKALADLDIYQAAIIGQNGPEEMFALPSGTRKDILSSSGTVADITPFFPRGTSSDLIERISRRLMTTSDQAERARLFSHQDQIRNKIAEELNKGSQVVGHNIKEFDLKVLDREIQPEAVDTLEMSRRMTPRASHTLGGIYKDVTGSELVGAHDAFTDVAATKLIHEQMRPNTQDDRLGVLGQVAGMTGEARQQYLRGVLRYARPLAILQQFKQRAQYSRNAAGGISGVSATMRDQVAKILGIDTSAVSATDPAQLQQLMATQIDPILARHAVGFGATNEFSPYAQYAVAAGGFRDLGDFNASYKTLGQDLRTLSFDEIIAKSQQEQMRASRGRSKTAVSISAPSSTAVPVAIAPGVPTAGFGGGMSGGSGGGGGFVGGTGGTFGGGPTGPVGPITIHTDSTIVHSAVTHLGDVSAVRTPSIAGVDPTAIGHTGGALSAAAPSTVDPLLDPTATTEMAVDRSGIVTISNATISTLTGSAVEVKVAAGNTVHVNANFGADSAGALKKSLVYVGTGGTTISGMDAGVRSSGGYGYARLTAAQQLALSKLEQQRGIYREQLSQATDPTAQDVIRQKLNFDFGTAAGAVLNLESARNPHLTLAMRNSIDRLSANPEQARAELNRLRSLTQVGLEKTVTKISEIEADPVKTAPEKEAEIQKIRETEAALTQLSAVIGELSREFEKLTQASITRGPYTSSGTGSTAGTRSRYGPAIETENIASQNALKAMRAQYDQYAGRIGTQNVYDSRRALTDQTRQTAASLINQNELDTLLTPAEMSGLSTAVAPSYNEVLAAVNEIQPMADEDRTLEQLAVNITRIASGVRDLSAALEKIPDTALTAEERKIKEALPGINKTVDAAITEQKGTTSTLETVDRQRAKTFEESLQATYGQQGLLRRITGSMRRELTDINRNYLQSFLPQTAAGQQALNLMMNQQGMLTAYNNRGRAVVLDTASEEEVRNLQKRVKSETGVDVSLEQLRALQTASARGRQAGNQSPFNDPFFFAMSRMRDLQFFGQTVMSTTQIPQQISQMIEQVGDPQLRADRILTTARALSLSPETYTKALAAAGKQQSMFGGTLTKNLEEMTSFIPIANTYGIDVGKSVQVARKLAAFDPAQGMGGASIALKEFLSGNVSSLSRRFEINRSELSRINTGDAGQMLESLDLLLSKMGVTDKLIDEQANSLAAKYDRMTGRLESLQVQFSAFAVGLMTPALEGVLGDDSAIARRVKASSTQKAVNERLRSYADSIVGNPVAGLKSLDIFSPTFSKELDIVLSKANDRTIAEAGSYGDVTGELSSVELYRQIGNMTDANKLKMQRMAQLNVLAGMNQDEAILKAMRDTNGDFNTSEEFMGQRRKLGFYNTASAEGRQRERDAFRRASTKTFNSNISNPGEKVTLVRQLDADTYIVRNAAGKEERVRIAGIDAPESATEAGAESTEEAGKFLAGKQLRLRRRGGLDPYGRTIGDISANNVDLASILVQQGYARVYNESDATKRAALEILQQTAADQGRGSVNKQAALLGLGANPIVSDEARSQYFRDTYLSTAGLFGVGGGAVLGGGLFALNSAAGTAAATSPIASLFTFLGGSASSAGTAAIPVAAPALIAAGLAGGAYLGYAYNRDVNDTSSAKQRELLRIESEIEQRRVYQGIAQGVYGKVQERFRSELDQATYYSNLGYAGTSTGTGAVPYFAMPGRDPQLDIDALAQDLEATNKVVSERYNGLSEAEKRVYEVMVNNPITGEKSTVFAAIRDITALSTRAAAAQAAGTPDTVAEDLLKNKTSEINNFTRAATRTLEMAKELAFAQEYGIKVRYRPNIPRGERFESGMQGTLQNRVIDTQTYYGLSDSQKDEVNSQLIAVSSRANFQRFAKEYTDQSMEKLYQLTQQRFTQFTDANAVNALTAYNAPDRSIQALMANNYGMPNFTQLTTRQRIEQNAMQVLNRSQFVDGVEYDKSAGDNIRNAQSQAVKILLSQIQAYKEQEDITRQFNIQVKGTYSNFVQTMMNAADGGEMLTTYLSQGNPRGFLELSQQMSGFNVQSSLQDRVLMNNANLFGYNNLTTFGASGPGFIAPSYNMGYTMGPRGTIKFSEDLLSDPSKMLYNPATIQSVIMQAAQANTELVNRNIQFGFRMRDADINRNRSLEDINRNGMRTLEDIHRSYTRNMIQLTQQAEAQKRQGTASFYTNAVGANVSASEKARITAKREQGQQEASHIGQADVGGYLKTPEGMQDTELQAAFAEYQAVPWTDAVVKEAAWTKVMNLLQSRRTAAKTRYENATTTDEKSAAQRQLGYLDINPDREVNYRKYVDDMANQELDFAARKEQAVRNRDDLQRERRRLEQQGPELQKRLAEAKTPEEIRSAQDAIEDNRVSLEKNSQALQQNANEIDAVTKTAPLWADSWREAGKNILESTQSTISGLVTQLDDFNLKNAQTLADAYLGFTRAKEDMVRSFGDAATEIALAVPAKLAGALAATTNYQRGLMQANILYDSGKYTEAKDTMSSANRALALALYPEGTQGYKDTMAALDSQSNRFTAEGMKSADDNLGPSSLSAYGTTVNGKNVLRVVLFGKEADAIDNPGTVSTNQGGGNGEDAFLTNPRTGEKG
jgi:endonuclease YncB( thermonuclease family)